MTEIGQFVIQEHRIFAVRLITRLDRLRVSDVTTKGCDVITRIGAVIEQIILRDQVRPRELRRGGRVCLQDDRRYSFNYLELQPFFLARTVFDAHFFLVVGVSIGMNLRYSVGKEHRISAGCCQGSGLAVDSEVPINTILGLKRELVFIRRIVCKSPRREIFFIGVIASIRADRQLYLRTQFIEHRIDMRELAEFQGRGATIIHRHDEIALLGTFVVGGPNQLTGRQGRLHQRHICCSLV